MWGKQEVPFGKLSGCGVAQVGRLAMATQRPVGDQAVRFNFLCLSSSCFPAIFSIVVPRWRYAALEELAFAGGTRSVNWLCVR